MNAGQGEDDDEDMAGGSCLVRGQNYSGRGKEDGEVCYGAVGSYIAVRLEGLAEAVRFRAE